MSKKRDYLFYPLGISLDELIEQTEIAAKRTHWTMIVLILASVLIAIGFYNTTPLSFAPEGLASLNKFENLPVNNLAEEHGETMPLLDVYFGENDFKDTKFEKGFNPFYRDGKFAGLQRFICTGIYKTPDTDQEAALRGKYLYDSLNKATQKLLREECSDTEPLNFPKDPIKFNYLTTDLNNILTDKYLYNEQRFPDSMIQKSAMNEESRRNLRLMLREWKKSLEPKQNDEGQKTNQSGVPKTSVSPLPSPSFSPEVEPILSGNIKEFDLVRFNRLLLEAAFPKEINPSADIIPPREARVARELATHLAFDENVRYVKIPFFDTAIEVNDLGAFGGVGLIIILLLLRFSFSREIKNLNVCFRQAFYSDKLAASYHKMAMRLVLSVPKMEGESVNQTLSASAKYICILPALVITAGVLYDWYSIKILGLYPVNDVFPHLLVEDLCVLLVWYLSLRCLERITHIDEIWEDYHIIWEHYLENQRESHKALLSKMKTLDPESKLAMAVERRIYNRSREGRFRKSRNRILCFWGKLWLGRLLSLKNVARLMPAKPLRKIVEWISDMLWTFTKWVFRVIWKQKVENSDASETASPPSKSEYYAVYKLPK